MHPTQRNAVKQQRLPIIILLVAMASIQGGASLAKSLFP
ncbi:hypothetical protein ACUOFC_10525, partial [Escherichia sp. TWPC-MK]